MTAPGGPRPQAGDAAATLWGVPTAVAAGLVVCQLSIGGGGYFAIIGLVQVATFVNVLLAKD